MAKYRITIEPENICEPEKHQIMIGVSREQIEEYVKSLLKGRERISKVQRLSGTKSTVKELQELNRQLIEAKNAGNELEAQRKYANFDFIVEQLKKNMNCVAFSMAKKYIPEVEEI